MAAVEKAGGSVTLPTPKPKPEGKGKRAPQDLRRAQGCARSEAGDSEE